VADAWEKTRGGNDAGTYIVAVAGGMKFLLLRKNREDPNGSTWTLFVTERSPSAAWLPAGRWSSVPGNGVPSRAIGTSRNWPIGWMRGRLTRSRFDEPLHGGR
jgi:hypothetical protein